MCALCTSVHTVFRLMLIVFLKHEIPFSILTAHSDHLFILDQNFDFISDDIRIEVKRCHNICTILDTFYKIHNWLALLLFQKYINLDFAAFIILKYNAFMYHQFPFLF